MTNNSAQFIGSIPTYYDSGLGPNIFYDYADKLAEYCGGLTAANVLELAAGTGILSRRLRDALSSDARLVITDLNQPMLDLARKKFIPGENVEYMTADAMALPFDDAAFDLMVCQFGVMFFPDKPASYREAARVLKPGGHYVFNVWGTMADNPFAQLAQDVVSRIFPVDPPSFYKVPFHYGEPADVLADLTAAGWEEVDHETVAIDKTIVDPKEFAHALVYGNPFIDEIRQRGGVNPDEVVGAMYTALQDKFGPTPLTMPLSATTYICRMT